MSDSQDSEDDAMSFYSDAEEYWRKVRPTLNGMLGEYGSISDLDLASSRAFLRRFLCRGQEGPEEQEKEMEMGGQEQMVGQEEMGGEEKEIWDEEKEMWDMWGEQKMWETWGEEEEETWGEEKEVWDEEGMWEEEEVKADTGRALDCGAGIGRVTKGLLLPLFDTVDMVDVTREFLDEAGSFLGPELARRVGNYFCCGLQDFCPRREHYDVIWIQWVSGHLTDEHLVGLLARCRAALRPGGLVVLKDNVAHAGDGAVRDREDSSVCRELALVRALVGQAGLRVVRQERQTGFPEEIYQVWTLALR